MNNKEIRNTFYQYFKKHNHHKVLSAPLVPAKDPTLLFTNAGMNQFKSVFLQEEKREYKRAVSIQKCMRVSGKHNDFDEVGKSHFHHTFFEMLGNFSFGDYFKEKAIQFGWELLTQGYGFKPEQLWVTVFREDDEAFNIWQHQIGVPAHKIIRLDEKDNFWQMGETGPCGPCSEIHFDRGDAFGPPEFTDDNSRFLEVWNLVFMQYFKDESGTLNPLPAPSIDTGMGMDRLSTLLQGKHSNYANDLLRPLVETTAELAGVDPDSDSHRIDLNVVADHIRALTFLISDGVLPANDGRGYVLRRILRRAAKHGKSLGFTTSFLHKVSSSVIDVMKPFYPELEYSRDFVAELILSEEERFDKTLLNGLKRFEELMQAAQDDDDKLIPGNELFKLSDTFGFPIDFARDLAQEKDVFIDYKGYQQELEGQREKSRLSLAAKQKSVQSLENIDAYTTEFTGYANLEEEVRLLAIYIDGKTGGKAVSSIREGQEGLLVFDRTPFYAESGGQTGDTGVGKNDDAYFHVSGTRKAPGSNAYLHSVKIEKGILETGAELTLKVDASKRKRTAVHHSATHLLHAALREVLGLHVKQAGSYVGPDKLRFDFTHFKAPSQEELDAIENMVNSKVRENLDVQTHVVKFEEAIERGAMAIFEEKYSDVVRMLSMGDFSKELCGGTHLASTGEIGIFKITGESSIASGIRRVEAVAGEPGYRYVKHNLDALQAITTHFSQKPEHITEYLVNLEKQLKEKEKQLKKRSDSAQTEKVDVNALISSAQKIKEVPTIIALPGIQDRKQLSALADEIKNKARGIAVLFSNMNGKSAIIVSVAKELNPAINAGKIIRDVAAALNGKGGGRPDFAQAGGDAVDIGNFANLKAQVTDIISTHIT